MYLFSQKRTYVGYTDNINNRLKKHNTNKGAKYTRGNKWKVIFKKNSHQNQKQCLMNIT